MILKVTFVLSYIFGYSRNVALNFKIFLKLSDL